MARPGPEFTLVVVALIIQLFILPITNIDKYALWKRSEGAHIFSRNSTTRRSTSRYSALARAGHIPYRDFVIEYPPLAAALILAPGLVTASSGPLSVPVRGRDVLLQLSACRLGIAVRRTHRKKTKHVFAELGLVHALLLPSLTSGLGPARPGTDPDGLRRSVRMVRRSAGARGFVGRPGHLDEDLPGLVVIPATAPRRRSIGGGKVSGG